MRRAPIRWAVGRLLPCGLIAWVSLVAVWAAEKKKDAMPKSLPAVITYADAKASKNVSLRGELKFTTWPMVIGKEPVQIAYRDLISYRLDAYSVFHPYMRRLEGEKPRFVVCSLNNLFRGEFPFRQIDVVKPLTAEELMQREKPDPDKDLIAELDGGAAEAKGPPKSPVEFIVPDKAADLTAIPVEAIQKIEFIQVDWKPW